MTVHLKQIDRLLHIMKQLRDPENGCPWDIKQDFDTIAGYTIEEAYEVAYAIQQNDPEQICDELGDLLLQVVFHAQIATDKNLFDFEDVAKTISEKMVRRHPHIFADVTADTDQQVRQNWEKIKAEERAAKHQGESPPSLLDDIPHNMPALKIATKMQKRAATVGFDWPNFSEIIEKLKEETAELEEAVENDNQDNIKEELGDLLFVMANLARKAGVDAETALRDTNAKFERRFRYIETGLASANTPPEQASLADMELLWNEAKKVEKEKLIK